MKRLLGRRGLPGRLEGLGLLLLASEEAIHPGDEADPPQDEDQPPGDHENVIRCTDHGCHLLFPGVPPGTTYHISRTVPMQSPAPDMRRHARDNRQAPTEPGVSRPAGGL